MVHAYTFPGKAVEVYHLRHLCQRCSDSDHPTDLFGTKLDEQYIRVNGSRLSNSILAKPVRLRSLRNPIEHTCTMVSKLNAQ